MVGKVVVSAVSLILVVGVALAVVAVVHRRIGSNDDTETLSPKMKSVFVSCSLTNRQQERQKTLTEVAQNATADPREFIKVAVKSTVDEVTKSFNLSDSLVVEATTSNSSSIVKMGLEDCKDLLQFSMDKLQASFSTVGGGDLHSLNDSIADLKNWLSAVISYQQSCLDDLETDQKYKTQMQNSLDYASKLTSNALAIVSEISTIFGGFGLKFNLNPSGQRLLGATEVDHDGIPSWLSSADRRMLMSQRLGSVRPNVVVVN